MLLTYLPDIIPHVKSGKDWMTAREMRVICLVGMTIYVRDTFREKEENLLIFPCLCGSSRPTNTVNR